MAGVADAIGWARKQIIDRVPKAHLHQRDPDFIRDQLPGTWLLASLYFRADVRRLDRIPPEGPVLLVGNHSGGNVRPTRSSSRWHSARISGWSGPFYQLAHNLVVSVSAAGLASQVRHCGRQP